MRCHCAILFYLVLIIWAKRSWRLFQLYSLLSSSQGGFSNLCLYGLHSVGRFKNLGQARTFLVGPGQAGLRAAILYIRINYIRQRRRLKTPPSEIRDLVILDWQGHNLDFTPRGKLARNGFKKQQQTQCSGNDPHKVKHKYKC